MAPGRAHAPVGSSMAVFQIMEGRLWWAPELPGCAEAQLDVDLVLRMSDYAGDEDLRGGRYGVVHYGSQATAKACGPLALDQTIAFWRLLEAKLAKHDSVAVAAWGRKERANVAVILGGFLLKEGWSFEEVDRALKIEAHLQFPCSWAHSSRGDGHPGMSVRDCWLGLELAMQQGWLDRELLGDTFASSFLCAQYRKVVRQFDAAWLAPSQVLVAADPITVVADPDPETCRSLFPGMSKKSSMFVSESSVREESEPSERGTVLEGKDARVVKVTSPAQLGRSPARPTLLEADFGVIQPTLPRQVSMCTNHSQLGELEFLRGVSHVGSPRALRAAEPRLPLPESCPSTAHTVCKEYAPQPMSPETGGVEFPLDDFVTWCRARSVGLIVRVNLDNEQGIKHLGGSYSSEKMREFGIKHLNLPVRDHDGGVPDVASIRRFLEATTELLGQEEALLVHCKGGFGRSVVTACCYLIWKYDVSGRALLGWVRIARPGAITTLQQEEFLLRFRGVADLNRYLASQSDKACCTIS